MNDARATTKVGLFVFLSIILLGALLLAFSKGTSLFTSTYQLRLKAENVGGLKSRSAVLISGVEVGTVAGTELAPDGKSVTILLKIQKRHQIHRDARFMVEQIGLLGDQYVVVRPTANAGPILQDGDEVICESPFNLQAVARSTVGFIERVDEATRLIKDTIERINRKALSDATLGHFADTVENFREASEHAVTLIDRLSALIATNQVPITTSVTNIAAFTGDLRELSAELRQTIGENRSSLSNALENLRDASAAAARVAKQLDAGQGLAGGLIRDEEMRRTISATLLNLEAASSNVANYGLLYKPHRPKKVENTPSRDPLRAPKYQ